MAARWSKSKLPLFASKMGSMVSASSARARFLRLASKSCRTRPIVSSAPKKSLADNRAPALPFNRYVTFFVIAGCGCAADLITKQVVFNWLGIPPDYLTPDPAVVSRWRGDPQLNHLWWLWDEHFGFQTSLNRGALFGMGAGGWWIFASLSVIAFFGILAWLFVY